MHNGPPLPLPLPLPTPMNTNPGPTSNVQPLQHHVHPDEVDEEDDVVECSDDGNGDDSFSNPTSQSQIRYSPSPHALPSIDGVDAVGPHALFPSSESASDQLTLSFQGEVYVFDSVSPEKVQAVLLLLGGYEVPTGVPTPGMAPQNPRNVGDYTGRSNQPHRVASLNRFREKRKERCFDKKIRYTVRKEVALRMQRKKGQFTSSKSVSDDLGSSSADCNGGSGQEEQETICRNCGISSKQTPMMRRGPAGPRTLCNACGLKWANKGILRENAKGPIVGMQHHSMNTGEVTQLNSEVHGQDNALPAPNMIASSIGDN